MEVGQAPSLAEAAPQCALLPPLDPLVRPPAARPILHQRDDLVPMPRLAPRRDVAAVDLCFRPRGGRGGR